MRISFFKNRIGWDSNNPLCNHLYYTLASSVPNYHRGRRVTIFHSGASSAQCIDTLLCVNANELFACRDHDSRPHTESFQIMIFKIFEFNSNPKIILQNIM